MREILHVDMDAFFASVEILDRPELAELPVVVGHDGPRGVVAAASYAARKFGCHSAQPMAVAKRLCPSLVIMPGRFARYRECSDQVFEILGRYSPLVEPLSIDEAFLDLTGSQRLLGDSVSVARRIKQEIRQETGLTASVGVAPNKFLAKLASDLQKPDGLTVIRSDEIFTVLDPLPVGKLWGVGPKTAARLQGLGIKTIGDIRRMDPDVLVRRVGSEEAAHFHRLSRGEDAREVIPDHAAKSIGQEQTFGENLTDPDAVRDVLLEQSEQVARRVRRHGFRAGTVTVKIRFGDFQTVTRRCTLKTPSDVTSDLWHAARDQFDRWCAAGFSPVRLIGMSAGGLDAGPSQLDLFPDPQTARQRRLDGALDQITTKFGTNALRRGGVSGRPTEREKKQGTSHRAPREEE